jgi:hypothetical protein
MLRVGGFEDFQEKLEKVRESSRLFLFVLFDGGRGQAFIFEFTS